MEGTIVEPLKILEKRERLDWEYDGEADVLYVSIGRPKKATGVDIGQGVVVSLRREAEAGRRGDDHGHADPPDGIAQTTVGTRPALT